MTTHYLLAFLETRLSADALATVFERAGETRPLDELMDDTSWSSYPQMRRLLAASAAALGGSAELRRVANSLTVAMPDLALTRAEITDLIDYIETLK